MSSMCWEWIACRDVASVANNLIVEVFESWCIAEFRAFSSIGCIVEL